MIALAGERSRWSYSASNYGNQLPTQQGQHPLGQTPVHVWPFQHVPFPWLCRTTEALCHSTGLALGSISSQAISCRTRRPIGEITDLRQGPNTQCCDVKESENELNGSALWFESAPKCNMFFFGPRYIPPPCLKKNGLVVFVLSCWYRDQPNRKHNLLGRGKNKSIALRWTLIARDTVTAYPQTRLINKTSQQHTAMRLIKFRN